MDWDRLRTLAGMLRGIKTTTDRIAVGDQPIARLVDTDTVAFMLPDDADRDAVIASAPAVFSITPKYADMPIVLAKLATLTEADARARLRAAWEPLAPAPRSRPAAKPKPQPLAGPQRYYLAYTEHRDKPERRTFKPYGRGTVAAWLWEGWRSYAGHGRSWGTGLTHSQMNQLERLFERAAEAGLECPAKLDDAALRVIERHFDCTQHLFSIADDFEGVAWELYIFDEEYLADPGSSPPHPDHGDRRSVQDDGYRELLAKYGKHERTSRRSR